MYRIVEFPGSTVELGALTRAVSRERAMVGTGRELGVGRHRAFLEHEAKLLVFKPKPGARDWVRRSKPRVVQPAKHELSSEFRTGRANGEVFV